MAANDIGADLTGMDFVLRVPRQVGHAEVTRTGTNDITAPT